MTQAISIAARLTPNGRGAVATVRLSGECRVIDASPPLFSPASGLPLVQHPLGRIVFGKWGTTQREDVVVCRVDSTTIDIHCHGGQAAVGRILFDLRSRGCNIVDAQAIAERAQGILETELLHALSQASTARAAAILLDQHDGALRSAVEALLKGDGIDRRVAIREILRWAKFGLHLSLPWNVVLFGQPNVGKSSLINALVGYSRSIVFAEPGTTRDVVTVETAFDGWPVRLADTAGIRDEADLLEASGIERAHEHLGAADFRVLLVDTSQPPRPDDIALLSNWPDALVVAHKSDLPNVWDDRLPESTLAVSSRTGAGLDRLAEKIVSMLVPEVPPSGAAIPVTQRQVRLLNTALAAFEADDEHGIRAALVSFLA